MKTAVEIATLTDAELHEAIAHVGLVLSDLEQDNLAYPGNMTELGALLKERMTRERMTRERMVWEEVDWSAPGTWEAWVVSPAVEIAGIAPNPWFFWRNALDASQGAQAKVAEINASYARQECAVTVAKARAE